MILVGIYSSVTLLSRRNTLTNVVLKELSRDRLFSSAVRSEHEIQLKGIINKNIDYIETFQESEPKELSKDVAELVTMVKKEISGRKDPESS
jgi:DNA-directed RNA polymerase subunit F